MIKVLEFKIIPVYEEDKTFNGLDNQMKGANRFEWKKYRK